MLFEPSATCFALIIIITMSCLYYWITCCNAHINCTSTLYIPLLHWSHQSHWSINIQSDNKGHLQSKQYFISPFQVKYYGQFFTIQKLKVFMWVLLCIICILFSRCGKYSTITWVLLILFSKDHTPNFCSFLFIWLNVVNTYRVFSFCMAKQNRIQ